MLERRQIPRDRVYYGGMVAFNARSSTLACVVRNFSPRGAKIEFENSAAIPEQVDFEIARRGLSCLARLVWCDRNAAGLTFSNMRETNAAQTGDVIPLDWARKLRASERENGKLRSRLDQILSES
jgi:PilZ domain